jgi:hypothetical protein
VELAVFLLIMKPYCCVAVVSRLKTGVVVVAKKWWPERSMLEGEGRGGGGRDRVLQGDVGEHGEEVRVGCCDAGGVVEGGEGADGDGGYGGGGEGAGVVL